MKRLKIKNALSALISRLNTVKERIEEHEDDQQKLLNQKHSKKEKKQNRSEHSRALEQYYWSNTSQQNFS